MLEEKDESPVVLPTNVLAFKKLLSSPEHKEVARGFIGAFFGPEVAAGEITISNPYSIVGNTNGVSSFSSSMRAPPPRLPPR